MNTTEIYYAQLSVSEHYTIDTITNLIDKLKHLGSEVYYDVGTRSINIENPTEEDIEDTIREELKQWINELPAEKNDIETLCDNIDFVFNITKINDSTIGIIVKVYLY